MADTPQDEEHLRLVERLHQAFDGPQGINILMQEIAEIPEVSLDIGCLKDVFPTQLGYMLRRNIAANTSKAVWRVNYRLLATTSHGDQEPNDE